MNNCILKKTFFLFFLTAFIPLSFAQDSRQISGIVTDAEDGSLLIGVSVVVQGTTIGTISDINGRFTLNVPQGKSLVLNYIGYMQQVVAVTSESFYTIAMKVDAHMLDEVVAIGYGTMKKSDLTGAVGSVSGEKLRTAPVAKIDQALQGKLAGVTVNANSGQPGADAIVRVRGVGTINNAAPIYVVDGLITDNINFLSSSDIASLEVLKDASACAIYGSRGANGVIMITTRKGEAGKANVNFETYFGVQNRWKKMNVVGRDEQANFLATFGIVGTKAELEQIGLNEWIRSNLTPDNDTYFPRIMTVDPTTGLPGGDDPNGIDYTLIETDWQDEVFQKNASIQNYSFSVDGGSDKMTYLMSANYFDQDGLLIGSYYKRLSLRLNTSFQVKKWLKIGENLSYSNSTSRNVQGNGNTALISSALSMGPWDPVKYPEGTYSNSTRRTPSKDLSGQYSIPSMKRQVTNPFVQVFNSTPNNNNDDWAGDIYAEITPVKGLVVRGDISMKLWNGMNRSFTPVLDVIYNPITKNFVNASMGRTQQLTYEGTATYNTIIAKKHDLTVMLGATYEETNYYSVNATGLELINTAGNLQYVGSAPDEIRQNEDGSYYSTRSGGDAVSRGIFASYLGRLHYVYNNKYLLTGSFRYDGSSKFIRGRMWDLFPSMAAAWKISEEDFFEPLKDKIDFLKIRAGWGQLGNTNSIGQNAAVLAIERFIARYTLGYPNAVASGLTLPRFPMEITWEKTEQTDIGIDFGLFNGLLHGTIDVFNRDTKDMLMRMNPPAHVGSVEYLGGDQMKYPTGNASTVRNRGMELSLEHRNKIGNFSYNIGGNISFINNELVRLNGGEPLWDGIIMQNEGYPLNTIYTLVYDGVFQNRAEIENYTWTDPETGEVKKIQPNAAPGDAKYLDLDGDGQITDSDRKNVGNPFPTTTYGINLSAEYKGFDLQVFFQGIGGVQVYNGMRKEKLESSGGESVLSTDMRNVFFPGPDPDDPAKMINVMPGSNGTIPNPTKSGSTENSWASSRFVEDASYLRLKYLQIGYTIPKSITKKIDVERLRFYIGGSNLFTFTKYKGFDPEVGNNGMDYGNFPQARTILCGLSMNF